MASSGNNKVLHQLIQKLGLTNYDSLAPKATELQRLLAIRSSSGAMANIGDYAKATLCIDLASSLLGLPFDTETALKLSGLKKPSYANGRRTLEKILDINKILGIGEICVQVGLSQVQKEATALLEAYKRYAGDQGGVTDFTHPQYATMAVFQACKRQKIKPPKTKLVPLSHLKPAQWTMLEKNWDKFLSTVPLDTKQPKTQDVRQDSDSIREKAQEASSHGDSGAGRKHPSPEKLEPYQNWKKRMLEKAYRELEQLRGSG
ncbi:origin recognition complex subunit 6 [Anopheles maculipalpis]|uniref:origin recognition complex subunit 6 n=1 Tax=Anopheles maculipalpis TaxID=1496333 RepID=UPI002158CA20|nr:origin recognition complex subunit 6 [Anopheles maculipalpis]